MSVVEIKKYPETVLNKKAAPVAKEDRDLPRLIDNMVETMYAAAGIGLAAPQVGVAKRVIVIDIGGREGGDEGLIVLVNPEIILAEGLVESEEGCLSVPQYIASLKRAERVIVRGLDRTGNAVEISAEGLLARALQHEIDHLDGVLILDRISAIKREFYKKRYLKALKESQAKA
ncbi:MAG TPA: peptide deformylase [Dissulfurispiraceae bacterium]|nr:peptide deformylase [Dissulfurispiraceae bacterium]